MKIVKTAVAAGGRRRQVLPVMTGYLYGHFCCHQWGCGGWQREVGPEGRGGQESEEKGTLRGYLWGNFDVIA